MDHRLALKSKTEKQNELLNNIIRIFSSLISKLNILIEEMKKHQLAVRISKGIGSVVGVVGAGLLFSPLAPLVWVGFGLGAAAGVSGVGAAVGDIVKTRNAQKQIEEYIEKVKEELEKIKEELNDLQESIKVLEKVIACSQYTAIAGQVGAGVTKVFLTVGDDIAAGSLVGSAFIRGTLAVGDEVAVAALNTTRLVSNIFGAVGAGLGVVDAVYTAVKENTSIGQAQKLKTELEEKIKTMEDNIEDTN